MEVYNYLHGLTYSLWLLLLQEEVDAGAIVAQDSVPVYPTDSEESLAERVKTIEHTLYPRALDLVAREQAVLGPDNKIIWKN